MLTLDWTLESGYSQVYFFSIYAFFLLEWIIFSRWVFQLNYLLENIYYKSKLEEIQAAAKIPFVAQAKVANMLLTTSLPRRQATCLALAAASIGTIAVAISIIVTLMFIYKSDGSSNPDGYPLLCLFFALRLSSYIGTTLSIIHLSINYKRHWIAAVALFPLILLLLGLFSIGWAGKVTTKVCFLTLFILPFIIVQRRHGASTRKEFDLKASFVRLSWIAFSAIASGAILYSWNWYDQEAHPHRDKLEFSLIRPRPHDVVKNFVPLASEELTFPPVFLNLGGGGSRAAIFGALILKELWWLPAPAGQEAWLKYKPIPEYVRKFAMTDGVFYPGRLLLLNTRFVSSVSGGSLASAYWTDQCTQELNATKKTGMMPLERRAHALKAFFEREAPDKRTPSLRRLLTMTPEDVARRQEYDLVLDYDPYVNVMRKNYLAATIIGLFNTSSSRSQSVREAFRSFGFPNSTRFSDLAPLESSGELPYFIFNATLTTTGERFGLSNLGKAWFQPLFSHGIEGSADLPITLSNVRFASQPGKVLVHNQVDPQWDPLLTTAVWISSDFPYGFPINRMMAKIQGIDREIGSLDGGISDNLGLNSTMSIIRRLRHKDKKDSPILNDLFILDIDTSELGFDPGTGCPLIFHKYEADNTIKRAKQVAEQTLSALYLSEIANKFGQVEKTSDFTAKVPIDQLRYPGVQAYVGFGGKHWGWYRVRSGEVRDEHVSTSWHLGTVERKKLYQLALGAEVRQTLRLASANYLKLITRSMLEQQKQKSKSKARSNKSKHS